MRQPNFTRRSSMSRLLSGTRLLVVVPVVGLALAAAIFFVFGGVGLLRLLAELVLETFTDYHRESHGDLPPAVEIVEYVHQFLIGTVLYITAIGLYQLFIHEIEFPGWLKVDSTEQLEMNLIGVTVVVLAVHFLSIVFTDDADRLLKFGAGIALPIAALALFVGLRVWSSSVERRAETEARLMEKDLEPSRED
jgi:uncharacterized membrane protein YqhA